MLTNTIMTKLHKKSMNILTFLCFRLTTVISIIAHAAAQRPRTGGPHTAAMGHAAPVPRAPRRA